MQDGGSKMAASIAVRKRWRNHHVMSLPERKRFLNVLYSHLQQEKYTAGCTIKSFTSKRHDFNL